MAFLTELTPARAVPLHAAPGIRRIVANNPGAMTYHGTNTYLIEGVDGVTVLDPGPDDAAHVDAVLQAAGRVALIVISHGHLDHVGALPALRAATGAPVAAFAEALAPDQLLVDGSEIAGFTALHTPGHAPDHLCFARDDGVVLTADHVMGWSTSVVNPPEGDMAAYFASLHRMLGRADRLYLPGHGPAVHDPADYGQFLLAHRTKRENAIVAQLSAQPRDTPELVDLIYTGLAPHLHKAAQRNVTAHLLKLAGEGRAGMSAGGWILI